MLDTVDRLLLSRLCHCSCHYPKEHAKKNIPPTNTHKLTINLRKPLAWFPTCLKSPVWWYFPWVPGRKSSIVPSHPKVLQENWKARRLPKRRRQRPRTPRKVPRTSAPPVVPRWLASHRGWGLAGSEFGGWRTLVDGFVEKGTVSEVEKMTIKIFCSCSLPCRWFF